MSGPSFGLSQDAIERQLRAYGVPPHKAKQLAEQHGAKRDEKPALLVAAEKVVRREKVEFERRKFRLWCHSKGLPNPTHELRFAVASHGREWRWDWAWPDADTKGGVALEIDGGGHVRGRHHRPKGFQEDQEKRRVGVELGWRVINVTPQTLYTDATAATLAKLLCVPAPTPTPEDHP